MKLRTKLVMAELPLALVLVAVAIYARARVVDVSDKTDAIFVDNYKSVVATQNMGRLLDAADSLLLGSLEATAPVRSSEVLLADFDRELQVQEHNITEPGELEATNDLRAAYAQWAACVREVVPLAPEARWRAYRGSVRPLAAIVKRHNERVLEINQGAMLKKATNAGHFSQEVVQTFGTVSIAAVAVVIAIGFVLSDQIARPLVRLARSAHRISEGDLETEIDPETPGTGEVETLIREFGRMTEKLRSYRQSSLGELLEATESAQSAIDSLVDPVLAFNEDGSFRRANDAAGRILGLDSNSADPIAPLAPEVRAAIGRVRDDVLQGKGHKATRGFENAIAVLVEGRPCYFQPVATPIRAEVAGTVVGVTVLLRDVTQLRRADELKNDLLSTVAHEIRTPLTSIRMAIHLCLEGAVGPITAKQDEVLGAARDDAERLHNLVEGILSVSKIEAGSLVGRRRTATPRELVEAATAGLRLQASDRGITLEVTAQDAPTVEVDTDSVELVLANMLSNALKHTPREGKITVLTKSDSDSVTFEVRDTGPGIAPEHRPRLFEKFYRVPGSPPGGSGLGLSIARDVVFAHEGEIGVESEVGKGSRFWFKLPSTRPGPREANGT